MLLYFNLFFSSIYLCSRPSGKNSLNHNQKPNHSNWQHPGYKLAKLFNTTKSLKRMQYFRKQNLLQALKLKSNVFTAKCILKTNHRIWRQWQEGLCWILLVSYTPSVSSITGKPIQYFDGRDAADPDAWCERTITEIILGSITLCGIKIGKIKMSRRHNCNGYVWRNQHLI